MPAAPAAAGKQDTRRSEHLSVDRPVASRALRAHEPSTQSLGPLLQLRAALARSQSRRGASKTCSSQPDAPRARGRPQVLDRRSCWLVTCLRLGPTSRESTHRRTAHANEVATRKLRPSAAKGAVGEGGIGLRHASHAGASRRFAQSCSCGSSHASVRLRCMPPLDAP
eukprot:scaffold17778_cov78-Phaeocystis_antarctica.AAC.12